VSRAVVSSTPVPFLRPVPGLDDLVHLGVSVPGTSNTMALKKSSESRRGDVGKRPTPGRSPTRPDTGVR